MGSDIELQEGFFNSRPHMKNCSLRNTKSRAINPVPLSGYRRTNPAGRGPGKCEHLQTSVDRFRWVYSQSSLGTYGKWRKWFRWTGMHAKTWGGRIRPHRPRFPLPCVGAFSECTLPLKLMSPQTCGHSINDSVAVHLAGQSSSAETVAHPNPG
jgi:hypothetical protein